MKPSRRRGFSLIEVVSVLGVSTVVAGMALWLVHVSMQKSRDGQKHLAVHNTVARLADTFRGDAHAAVAIAEEKADKQGDAAAGSTWLISLASGGAVRYRLEPGRLVRSEYDSPPARDNASQKPVNQDSFNFPEGCTISIELEPPSQPRIATLFITTPTAADTAGTDSRPAAKGPYIDRQRIDAAMSRDTRFDNVTTLTNKKPAASKETDK